MAWTTINRNFMKHINSCEHSNKELLLDFINANGFSKMTECDVHWNVKWLLVQGGYIGSYNPLGTAPPYIDHSQYFKNTDTGVCCLTYNTYEKIDTVRAALAKWSANSGLKFEVYEPEHSWYYPNKTCFVVIHLSDDEIKLK